MIKDPLVTFIICTYNRADYLDNALDSLLNRHNSDDLPFELLVIDNNSSDHTPEIVQNYKNSGNEDCNVVQYVKETKQGLTHARNRGIREARAPYIVFLDDDIEASETLVPTWISFFEEHPDVIAAGGKIHVRFDSRKPKWISHFLLPLFGRHDLGNALKKYPANKYPFGGNMGFKKSVFEEVGYFDPDIGKKGELLYAKGEEKELFQRVRSVSSDIYYLPDAFAYHHVDGSRLTTEYVKNQALGIGRGMKVRNKYGSVSYRISSWASEVGKVLVSIPLALGYMFMLQTAKAKLLLLFRLWIWKGYFDNNTTAKQ